MDTGSPSGNATRQGLGRRRGPGLFAATALSLVILAGCTSLTGGPGGQPATVAPGGPVQAVPQGTEPDDDVIGRREHPRIIAAYGGVYSNRAAEIMVARMVGRLLAAADQPNANFTITILDSPEINAFALPGGFVYVTRGILALANDTSELAAVIAHEIAHVTLRHARARAERVRTTEIVDRVITGVLGGDPNGAEAQARTQTSMAAFSQQQELEADREGIRIAGRAGYDPHAAARFLGAMGRFARLARGDDGPEDFLSTHPSTPNRVERATEAARGFGAPGIGESDRAGYLAAIDGLTFGDSPNQGAVAGQRFIHAGLGFTFTVPRGYQLQNTRSAVVGVAGDGEAVRFDSADVPPSMSLPDYLRSGWIAGLRPETVTAVRHNGIDMATGMAQTDNWAFRVAVARHGGQVYRFIFAARADSPAFAQGVEETVRSFRPAQQADLDQIRRLTMRIVTAAPGDTADSLAARMGQLSNGRELFYALNDLYPGDPLEVGAQYKIVVVE